MANPNSAQPASIDFGQLVASRAIPGALTSNPAPGFPISGGACGGITGSASIDDSLKVSIEPTLVFPSLSRVFPKIQGALEGNAFDFVDNSTLWTKSSGNFFAPGQKNPLALVSGCGIAESTLGIGKGIGLPSPQGQGQTQGG